MKRPLTGRTAMQVSAALAPAVAVGQRRVKDPGSARGLAAARFEHLEPSKMLLDAVCDGMPAWRVTRPA
jgi:hypothetical protein